VAARCESLAASSSYCVDLIDEDDAGRLLFCLFEKVPHSGRSHANEHLYEFRSADIEERDTRLTGDCPCEQGFSRSRGPHEQGPFREAAAQFLVFSRFLQERDDFGQLCLRFIDPGDILEGDGYLVLLIIHFGFVFTECHRTGRRHPYVKEHPDGGQKRERQQPDAYKFEQPIRVVDHPVFDGPERRPSIRRLCQTVSLP